MRVFLFVVNLCLLLSISGCNTPAIKSSKPKIIYIASNFLNKSDTLIFQGFENKEKIKVVILPMTTDSILAHYNQYKYNSHFDLVIIQSTHNIDKLSQNEVLHTIEKAYLSEEKKFISTKSDWVTLGIDPYVVGGLGERKDFQYNELTYGNKWKNELNADEFTSFQTSVLFQFGHKNLKKSIAWLQTIDSQVQTITDTAQVSPHYLTLLSKAITSKKSYVYPSQSEKFGAFYDAVTVGIVRHSSNYTAGLTFIKHYIDNLVYNQRLCDKLNILPVQNPKGHSSFEYQNNYPMLFRCGPRDATKFIESLKYIHG